MNLLVFSISLFATICLGADFCIDAFLSPTKEYPIDSLFNLSIKQSAYMVACELTKVKGILITKTREKKIAMYVNANKLSKIMDAEWRENIFLAFAFPKMFNIDLVQTKLPLESNKVSFTEFKCILSKCTPFPEAKLVADIAILKFIVQTIDTKLDGQVVDIRPYDLKIICTLSLRPDLGKDYTTDVLKALDEIPKLLPSLCPITVKYFFYSLIALLKYLQSPEILAKLEQVFDQIFPLIVEHPMYQEMGFYCVLSMGKKHSLIAKLAEKVSKKQLAVWKVRSRDFTAKHKFDSFFLGGPWMRSNAANLRGVQVFADYNPLSELNIKASQNHYRIRSSVKLMESLGSFTGVDEFKKYFTDPITIRMVLIYEVNIFSSRVSQ